MIDRLEISRLESMPIEMVAERLGLRVERHKSLCPWHADRRPSLTFDTYRNRYRCYVCDAHGGVIDMVRRRTGCGFREAVAWLRGESSLVACCDVRPAPKVRKDYPVDVEWLSGLVRQRTLNEEARRFLFAERRIDPRVADWCGLTSISAPAACWRYGKPFYDAPSLLIPYYDRDGRLVSVQGRYLGDRTTEPFRPRFRFPMGSNCHIYGLQILRMLRPGEELWITEGCSDCWAMLSAGHKAIAVPSATLLRDEDMGLLRSCHTRLGTSFHIYPDRDAPGERLFLQLRDRLPDITRHQLPSGCKDFGEWWGRGS